MASSRRQSESTLSEPLLANRSVIMESYPARDEPKLSLDQIDALLWSSNLMGVMAGLIMSVAVLWAPILTFYLAHFKLDLHASCVFSVAFHIYRALVILVLAFAIPRSVKRMAIRHAGIINQRTSQKLQNVLELRIALGMLAGVIIFEAEMPFFLEYDSWDYAILSVGIVAGILCLAGYSYRTQFDYADLDDEEEDYECDLIEEQPSNVVVL